MVKIDKNEYDGIFAQETNDKEIISKIMELPFNEYKGHKPVNYLPGSGKYGIDTFNYIKDIYAQYFHINNR